MDNKKEYKLKSVLDDSIKKATRLLSPRFILNEKKYHDLMSKCNLYDMLMDDLYADYFSTDVDQETNRIIIEIEVENLEVDKNISPYCEIIKRTDRFGFEYSDNNKLLLSFEYNSIWDKA